MTNALNFSTQDCHIIGGCDVYTTKAARTDKKLYKTIDDTLESRHQNLVRLSASLSPPRHTASDDGKESEKDGSASGKRGRSVPVPDIDLSRNSPFGSLSQTSARRTFAYLIATLNASHPDYEFSNVLRPSDFKKERSLTSLMQHVDSTLYNLRPRQYAYISNSYLSPPSTTYSRSAPVYSAGNEIWTPKMWQLIDKEMGLRSPNCLKFSYDPKTDPFDGENGAIWSMHYLFFNKERKRVCYLHLRCLSVVSHSPDYAPIYNTTKRQKHVSRKASSISFGEGAGKRASYWLGNTALRLCEVDDASPEDDDDDDEMILEETEDEVDVPYMDLDEIRSDIENGYTSYVEEEEDEDELLADGQGWRSQGDPAWSLGATSGVKDFNEEVEEKMEV